MIINFANLGGGGGGGYVLPVATSEVLGGVKIGSGVNIDSEGTISVSGSDVANYAMALKDTLEDYKVVNENGYLYYVEQIRDDEEGIFVKIKQEVDMVRIYIDLSGQTAPEGETIYIVEFGDVTITLNENGELFYLDEESNEVYFDGEDDYTYGDFTFHWSNDGKDIEFGQNATSPIITVPQTGNADRLYMIATELWMANEISLGLVKIGEGIDLAEDGTISVQASDPTILKSVSALPLTAASGDVCVLNNKTYIYSTQSGVTCSVYNENIENGNDTEHVIQWYGDLPTDQILFVLTANNWGYELWYIDFDSNSDQFRLYKNVEEEIFYLPKNGAAVVLHGTISWSAKNGLITIYGNGINWEIGVYSNWNQVSGNHWEPLDWLQNTTNPRKFIVDYSILPNATSDRKGAVVVSTPSVNTEANYNQGIGCSETTNGFITDTKYINEAYAGTIGSRGMHNDDNSLDVNFAIYFNDNGELEWNVLDWNTYTYLASGAVQSGTSTVAQGEDYEATITLSGTTVEMAYTNPNIGTSVWLNNFEMPNIPILCYQANGTTYYVKQR